MKNNRLPSFSHGVLLLLFLTMLSTWFNPLNAQQEQRFKGGIVAGLNLSQIDGDKLGGFNQPGLNVGARVAAILAERWQLSMELLFSQQGSNRTINDDASAVLEKIRLNMVEVPVMVNFLEWKFHVSTGFSYGRVINYKVEDILEGDVTELTNYNENLFYFIIGATFYFNEHFGLNLAWSKALNDLQGKAGAQKLIARNIHIKGVYMF